MYVFVNTHICMYVTVLSVEQNKNWLTKYPFTTTRDFLWGDCAFIPVCALCRRNFLPQEMSMYVGWW